MKKIITLFLSLTIIGYTFSWNIFIDIPSDNLEKKITLYWNNTILLRNIATYDLLVSLFSGNSTSGTLIKKFILETNSTEKLPIYIDNNNYYQSFTFVAQYSSLLWLLEEEWQIKIIINYTNLLFLKYKPLLDKLIAQIKQLPQEKQNNILKKIQNRKQFIKNQSKLNQYKKKLYLALFSYLENNITSSTENVTSPTNTDNLSTNNTTTSTTQIQDNTNPLITEDELKILYDDCEKVILTVPPKSLFYIPLNWRYITSFKISWDTNNIDSSLFNIKVRNVCKQDFDIISSDSNENNLCQQNVYIIENNLNNQLTITLYTQPKNKFYIKNGWNLISFTTYRLISLVDLFRIHKLLAVWPRSFWKNYKNSQIIKPTYYKSNVCKTPSCDDPLTFRSDKKISPIIRFKRDNPKGDANFGGKCTSLKKYPRDTTIASTTSKSTNITTTPTTQNKTTSYTSSTKSNSSKNCDDKACYQCWTKAWQCIIKNTLTNDTSISYRFYQIKWNYIEWSCWPLTCQQKLTSSFISCWNENNIWLCYLNLLRDKITFRWTIIEWTKDGKKWYMWSCWYGSISKNCWPIYTDKEPVDTDKKVNYETLLCSTTPKYCIYIDNYWKKEIIKWYDIKDDGEKITRRCKKVRSTYSAPLRASCAATKE